VKLSSLSLSTMSVYISGSDFLQKYSQFSGGVVRISLVCLHMVGVYMSWCMCLSAASAL
jgi:hypothetical protein